MAENRSQTLPRQVALSTPIIGTARNYQKFSSRLKGLRRRLFAKLHSFPIRRPPGKQDVMAKQTKVTIETESLLILRGRTTNRAWCPACAVEREVIALEEIGVISNLERSALEEWLNSGNLHRLQTANRSTLICLNSLIAQVQKTKTP
jgi:hypothetical protein